MDMFTTKTATDFVIAVVAALIGATAGFFFERRSARRKLELERLREARDACLELRKVLADWMNEITDATSEAQGIDQLRARLQQLWEHERFERDIDTQLFKLHQQPLCANLLKRTAIFHRQVFETKGQISMALNTGDLMRNYKAHREAVLTTLRGFYNSFNEELEKVIPRLEAQIRL